MVLAEKQPHDVAYELDRERILRSGAPVIKQDTLAAEPVAVTLLRKRIGDMSIKFTLERATICIEPFLSLRPPSALCASDCGAVCLEVDDSAPFGLTCSGQDCVPGRRRRPYRPSERADFGAKVVTRELGRCAARRP